MTPPRSVYPYRAWCRRLRLWVYLSNKPSPSFRLTLFASQYANETVPLYKFNIEMEDIKLERVVKNPYYRKPK